MLGLLLGLPVLAALFMLLFKKQRQIAILTRACASLVIALSITFCVLNYNKTLIIDLSFQHWLPYATLLLEVLISGFIIYKAIVHKSVLLCLLTGLSILLSIGYEFLYKDKTEVSQTIFIDKLSLLMILIIGVIGGIICIYAVEYMKDYHRHNPEIPDRRNIFFTVMFLFLAAMFGIVITNQLSLLLLCWEISSLASFLLIGYTKTPKAVKNSFTAIQTNVFGGLLFTVGLVLLGVNGIADFRSLVSSNGSLTVSIAVFLLSAAALTKSAQFPFSGWLLGAMVAPTPSSALLHSSTMVKAGVYLLLRLSPMLGSNVSGITVTMIGGVTFLAAAMMAVSQTDSKRVLAHSTISNLGLIIACVGIGTPEAIWAAIMLVVFHAIAKSLLFLSVGSTSHQLGSRSIEDMDGLIGISKQLTIFLIIGIAGMFIAPFGMLIAKWAAMRAFLDSGNFLIVIIVAFASTITMFFWTKWLGKLIANAHRIKPTSYVMRGDEKVSLYSLAALVIIICLLHPLVSSSFIEPYINSTTTDSFPPPIEPVASAIIIGMLCLIFILPLILYPIYHKFSVKQTSLYLSGENTGDDESFYGGMGQVHRVELRNWYMQGIFGEEFWLRKSVYLGAGILIAGFFAVIGGHVV
jgi:ech hydrogenase subunit A